VLAGYREYSELIFAALFIAVVMFMPNGIAGLVSETGRRLLGTRTPVAP
jgi:ABC-type branched-subunit amino acid transport system permease subunit